MTGTSLATGAVVGAVIGVVWAVLGTGGTETGDVVIVMGPVFAFLGALVGLGVAAVRHRRR